MKETLIKLRFYIARDTSRSFWRWSSQQISRLVLKKLNIKHKKSNNSSGTQRHH